MVKPYFPPQKSGPRPLKTMIKRRVRFEEVDPLAIVWHGRYASFFEDARASIGEKYGIGYLDFYNNQVVAPIKILHVDYMLPLRFYEEFTIEGILHWSESARINFEYIIRNSKDEISTTGYTVQVMLDRYDNLLLVPPPFYEKFRKLWKEGKLG